MGGSALGSSTQFHDSGKISLWLIIIKSNLIAETTEKTILILYKTVLTITKWWLWKYAEFEIYLSLQLQQSLRDLPNIFPIGFCVFCSQMQNLRSLRLTTNIHLMVSLRTRKATRILARPFVSTARCLIKYRNIFTSQFLILPSCWTLNYNIPMDSVYDL
jgi:hypothetical protein